MTRWRPREDPPTMTGLPFNRGSKTRSTEAQKASPAACKMVRCMLIRFEDWGLLICDDGFGLPFRQREPLGHTPSRSFQPLRGTFHQGLCVHGHSLVYTLKAEPVSDQRGQFDHFLAAVAPPVSIEAAFGLNRFSQQDSRVTPFKDPTFNRDSICLSHSFSHGGPKASNR